MPELVRYPIFIILPEDDEYHLGKYLAVGEQFGLCHGFGQTKEEALADLRKNIEERERLAQLFAGDKPASEMVIEDRGPYYWEPTFWISRLSLNYC